MKKLHTTIAVLLAFVMSLALVSCGGGGGKDDPNAGKYLGYQVDFLGWTPMEEIYGEGENYVVLEGGGKGDISLDGQEISLKWTMEGEALSLTMEGETMTGTLKDGVLIFDFMGMGDMCFVKEGVTPPQLEGSTLDENIDDMVDEALDDFTDEYLEDGGGDGAPTGELAELEICDGAYTLTYPTDTWAPSDMGGLSQPAGFGIIRFYVQENQDQVDETINNLNVTLETAADYQITETSYMGAYAQEVLITGEYGDQSLKVLVEYGEDMGPAGVALFMEVSAWDYLDQDEVRSILDSIVMN